MNPTQPPECPTVPRQHILVVEDDPEIRRLCQAILLREGHRVDAAADGQDGWERLLAANTAGTPALVRATEKAVVLADCREFRITRHRLERGEHLAFAAGEQARIVSVTEGRLSADGQALAAGDNALLSYAGDFAFTAEHAATVLVTDRFSSLENGKA